MNPLLIKATAVIAIVLAIAGTTWFAADAHYSKQYAALKAQITQEAKDQQKAVDEEVRNNTTVSKEVNDEAVKQIGRMSDTISDLLMRKPTTRTIEMCTSSNTTGGASTAPDGRGTTSSTSTTPGAQGSVAIDAHTLDDTLTLGIDAITAELLWREWARGVK